MKRLFLMVVAMLSMTMTFAENENANNVNNVNAYDMKVNMHKLGETLKLTFDQVESVNDVHNTFCGEMMVASQTNNNDERKELVKQAVYKDLKYMHYILTEKQYRKYLLLLNTTLNNRGIVVE